MKLNFSKSYNWEIIVWQEHWSDVLDLHVEIGGLRCPALLSPLHDIDRYSQGKHKGELKKPHWHLLLFSDSTKTFKQMAQIDLNLNQSGDGANVYPVLSKAGAVHYLTHDGYEIPGYKFKYDNKDVVEFGGAVYADLFKLKSDSNFTMLINIINNNDINTYSGLLQFLYDCPDFHYLIEEASKKCYALQQYMWEAPHKRKNKNAGELDSEEPVFSKNFEDVEMPSLLIN